METFSQIIYDFGSELSKMSNVSDKIPEQMEYAIGHCKIALDRMRDLVIRHGFEDNDSEIRFFKEIKPSVYGQLLFFQKVFDIESRRILMGRKGLKQYFQKELNQIAEYMNVHHIKVQYYRCNYTHLDEKYFLRDVSEIPIELRNNHKLMDESFFTWHDHTFSVIKANDLLVEYLHKELKKGERPEYSEIMASNFNWTANKIDLVELIYALHFSHAINGGRATIKELTELFEKVFNLDLKNDVYRFYTEIQQRKIDQIKFLNQLRSVMLQRLDENNK